MAQDASAPQPGTFAAFLAEVAAAGGQAHMRAFAELGVTSRALVGPAGPALAVAGVPEQVILELVRPTMVGPAPSALVPRRGPTCRTAGLWRRPHSRRPFRRRPRRTFSRRWKRSKPTWWRRPPGGPWTPESSSGSSSRRPTASSPGRLPIGSLRSWRRASEKGAMLRPALHRRGPVAPRARAAGRRADEHEEGGQAASQKRRCGACPGLGSSRHSTSAC